MLGRLLEELRGLLEHVVGRGVAGGSSGTMGAIRETNYVFKPKSKDAWMQWFGGQ